MNIHESIIDLTNQISDPSCGLPEEIFLFVSGLTPMVNVDLLIKDERGRTLLSWRDDQYAGKGWHLPGGIVRFKEKLETRLMKVAEMEIGVHIEYEPIPIAVNQVICDHNTRGHFLSLLYKCYLSSDQTLNNKHLNETDPGYLMWHEVCPINLIDVHAMYRDFF